MTTETDLLPLPPLYIVPSVEPVDYPDVAQALMDYARANVAHATATLQAEIEELRAEVERANSWNERVSVCRDHVADIVDGPCVICALDAAKARADNLRADVAELRAARIAYASEFPATADGDPDTGNIHANIRSLKARAERLEDALREAKELIYELTGDPNFFVDLLREQEEGNGQ
jgi:DNA repair exonuclease SbcCD ATPase subunit